MTLSVTRRKLIASLPVVAGASFLASRPARAQAPAWPSKPVRVLVAFAPGGLTDAYGRLYAEQFTARYGVPAVVENRPGAGGNIAIEAMTKSPADGYTLLFSTTGAVWQNRVLYRKLPFDLAKDVAPVAIYPSGGLVMAVSEKVQARNYNEFVEWARKNPTVMGSNAPASFPHMMAEQMNKDHGLKIQCVHYKGESPMWLDVATGATQVAVGSYQAMATVLGRGVRPIGVTNQLRLPKLPDLPTLTEQGNKSELVLLSGGLSLTVPSATPEDIQRKLAAVATDGTDAPKYKALRESFGIPDTVVGLEESRRVWREVAPKWIAQAESLGVKLD